MAWKNPPFVFQGMTEGKMGNIVYQRRQGNGFEILLVYGAGRAFFDKAHDFFGHETRSQGMLKPGVHGAGINQVRRTQLLDSP